MQKTTRTIEASELTVGQYIVVPDFDEVSPVRLMRLRLTSEGIEAGFGADSFSWAVTFALDDEVQVVEYSFDPPLTTGS
jgi:hypothetical protein